MKSAEDWFRDSAGLFRDPNKAVALLEAVQRDALEVSENSLIPPDVVKILGFDPIVELANLCKDDNVEANQKANSIKKLIDLIPTKKEEDRVINFVLLDYRAYKEDPIASVEQAVSSIYEDDIDMDGDILIEAKDTRPIKKHEDPMLEPDPLSRRRNVRKPEDPFE